MDVATAIAILFDPNGVRTKIMRLLQCQYLNRVAKYSWIIWAGLSKFLYSFCSSMFGEQCPFVVTRQSGCNGNKTSTV